MRPKVDLDDSFFERAVEPRLVPEALAHARLQVACARRLYAENPTGETPGILGRELVRLAQALHLADAQVEARDILKEAIDIWERLGRHRALFMARMKMAGIQERAGNTGQAGALWDLLARQCIEPDFSMYQDFVFFGRGVFLWRQGDGAGAVADLGRSLQLRSVQGRLRLVEVTARALEAAQKSAGHGAG